MCLVSEAFRGNNHKPEPHPLLGVAVLILEPNNEVNMNFEETTTQTRLITRSTEHSIPNASVII